MSTTSSIISGVYRTGYIEELKYSKNNVPYINLSIAFNDNFRHNDEGIFVYDTHWMKCIAYYKTAQKIAESIRMGALVFISGSLSFQNRPNKDGIEVKKPLVIVSTIQKLLDSKKDNVDVVEDESNF